MGGTHAAQQNRTYSITSSAPAESPNGSHSSVPSRHRRWAKDCLFGPCIPPQTRRPSRAQLAGDTSNVIADSPARRHPVRCGVGRDHRRHPFRPRNTWLAASWSAARRKRCGAGATRPSAEAATTFPMCLRGPSWSAPTCCGSPRTPARTPAWAPADRTSSHSFDFIAEFRLARAHQRQNYRLRWRRNNS
jgi:hypothetical protein